MLGKLKIVRQKFESDDEEEKEEAKGDEAKEDVKGEDTQISFFKRKEELRKPELVVSSISIPEFLTGEPYPYFYHKWNKLLLCNLNDVSEIFHINNSNDLEPNIYVFNNDLKDVNSRCSNFETQHNKYGNSLQNYYTIVNQTAENVDSDWKEKERINITSITPIYLQKCENIMTTLLFMPLDQCHDFRGGRTSGSSSWVTEISTGTLKKDVDVAKLVAGISDNLYSNDFMNTSVKTSFSGKQGVVGIMVIGDSSLELLNTSEYKKGNDLDFQKIMDMFGQFITIGGDINMNCDPRGNRFNLKINGSDAYILFLGFTSDGWDKGMHDVWNMNERKHIYSIKIDSIKRQTQSSELEVIYSGDKVTVIGNIVPCYEMIYKSKDESNADAFINHFQLSDGKKITKSNFNDFFSPEAFDKLYNDFLAELYRTGKEIKVEEDAEGQEGGTIDETSILRGAAYKFYGVRAPDSKTSERMSSENRTRHVIFENIFIEILKKISKNISPQIHPDFKYPDIPNLLCNDESEQINDRIDNVNALFKNVKEQLYAEYPKTYNKDTYESLRSKMDNGSTEDRFIIKQFGTVNDMNIAPVVERVIDSLNCSDNCKIINIERVIEEEEEEEEEEQTSKSKKKEITLPCQIAIETNIKTDLNNKYPFKFQVVSGVLDSSLQGGENMPEYFPPEMDIFMTIFDNQGNLQGAIVRITFLKVILKNTTNTKNNARVYSHFIYVEFDEINLECEDKLGSDWKLDSEKYPFAIKQLLDYVVNKTSFLPSLTDNLISNFELRLKDDTFKRWYFYFTDTAGPSVSEGINDVVKKIFSGKIGLISNDNVDVSESIVKVAQKIYMDSPNLREIFKQQTDAVRSYAFESIFLLKIKYIGDKSRCTDSLFLNRNKYAECMQITGDENAYFTALINGASTIYSPPSKFALYFAPYFTYGDVENKGKFLLNLPLYKETLLKGESPSMFKISSSSSRKRSINTDDTIIPFESSLIIGRESPPLSSGIDVRNKANKIIKFINDNVDRAYADAQLKSSQLNNVTLEAMTPTKRNELKKSLNGYEGDYNNLVKLYDELKKTVDKNFITDIKNYIENNENTMTAPYYNKIIEQLENVLLDNDFIIDKQLVNLTPEDFESMKEKIITFFEKAIQSMKKMLEDNPSQMLDIDGNPVLDKKGKNTILPIKAIDDLKKFIPMYETQLNALKQTEDIAEFYNVLLKEINQELYIKYISVLKGSSEKVIFWDNKIKSDINFILSLSDIINHILPNIKIAKSKFASQTSKYDKFKDTVIEILSKLDELSQKKKPMSVPTKLEPKLSVKKSRADSAPAVMQTTEAPPDKEEQVPEKEEEVVPEKEEEGPKTVVQQSSSVLKARAKIGRPVIDGGGDSKEESYRRNQIYILKCFSNLITTNNELYQNVITSDKRNFNYTSIDTIDKYCISILMLQTYYSLNSFQPKLNSLKDVTDEITKLNEDSSSLQDAINIRNYYSQIINTFIDIEYLQPDAIDYILNLYNVYIEEGDNFIYDMKKWCDINYWMLTFIYENLKLINSGTSKFIDPIDTTNYGIITKIYDIISDIDIEVMSGYYELSKSREMIDSFVDFTPEEKENYKKDIAIVDSYEYLCLFLVKYCNNLFMRITNNQLTFSDNGALYNYDIIKNKLNEEGLTELSKKFDEMKINIGSSDNVSLKLFDMDGTDDIKSDLDNISNILLELSNVPEVIEVSLKDIGKGISSKPFMLQRPKKYVVPIQSRKSDVAQAAGTFKNKKIRNKRKTRNNKKSKKNRKSSIKKRENKMKRYTRKS